VSGSGPLAWFDGQKLVSLDGRCVP
jgi:hypothetical protein